MPRDSILLLLCFLIPTAVYVMYLRRKPGAWRVYTGRWGLAVGLIALASSYLDRLHR